MSEDGGAQGMRARLGANHPSQGNFEFARSSPSPIAEPDHENVQQPPVLKKSPSSALSLSNQSKEAKSQDEELLMRIGILKNTARELKDERPIMQQIFCPSGGFDMTRHLAQRPALDMRDSHDIQTVFGSRVKREEPRRPPLQAAAHETAS